MGARNCTSLLLLLLFPHQSSCIPCRGTLADVEKSPLMGKAAGAAPSGFSRQFWILWERVVSVSALNHIPHGMAGLSGVAGLGGEGFMLEKHSCVTVAGMLCW